MGVEISAVFARKTQIWKQFSLLLTACTAFRKYSTHMT